MFRLVSFTSLVLFSSSHYLKLRGFSNGLVRKDYNQREREGGGEREREGNQGRREGERVGAISIIFLSKGDISERSIIITRWCFGIITMVCVHNKCTYFEVLIFVHH